MSKAEISMCWKLLETGIRKPAIICILTCEETKPKMSSQLVIGNISQRSQDFIFTVSCIFHAWKGGWEGADSGSSMKLCGLW